MNIFAEVGGSLQQIGGECPDGWVVMQGERPSRSHVASVDGQWVIDHSPRIAARRYEAEVGGITLNGLQINTDDRSKLLINGAASRAARNPSYVLNWKTPAGYIQIPAEQVLVMGDAVADHVQACFDRESELLTALESGTLTPGMIDQGWP
jgi:hypothetical protein